MLRDRISRGRNLLRDRWRTGRAKTALTALQVVLLLVLCGPAVAGRASPRPIGVAQQLIRYWNRLQLKLKAVDAHCWSSSNGRYYCHLELRQADDLADNGQEQCLYVELMLPFEPWRGGSIVCDDGGGDHRLQPLGPMPSAYLPASHTPAR